MSDSNPDLQRLLLERLVLEADPAHLTSVLLRAGATMTIGDVLVGLERAALSPEAKARLSDAIRHMPIGAKAEPATLESVKARMREGMQRVAVSARPAKKAKKSPPRAAKKAGKKAAKKAAKKATKKPGKKAGKKATARRGLSDAAQAKAAIDAGYARAADLKPTASKSNGNGKGDPSVLDARLETEVLSGRATPVRTSDVVNALEVSAATALRTLRRAVDRGVLVPQGQGRAAAYVRTESRLGLAEAMA